MKHKGFTIVELIVIITVIAILMAIMTISYSFLRDDGLDSNIKSTTRTVGDAIQLHESQTGSRLIGTGPLTASNGVDTLVPKYLKRGYRDGIKSKNASNAENTIRWYGCNDGSDGFVVYASLNNPTSKDTEQFDKLRSACGHGSTQAPTTGANIYNYAQVF